MDCAGFTYHNNVCMHLYRSIDEPVAATSDKSYILSDRETDVLACIPHKMYTYVRWRSRITYRTGVSNAYFQVQLMETSAHARRV